MKTQVEVEVMNVEVEVMNIVPTEESNKFGTVNGLTDRSENFFGEWAFRKKVHVGKKVKFFKEIGVEVGMTDCWNPNVLAILL